MNLRKKYLSLIFVIAFVGFYTCAAQNVKGMTNHDKPNYDSLWYFHAFSIDVATGSWIPIGTLSTHYRPALQLDFDMGLMVNSKMRFYLSLGPRFLNASEPISVKGMYSTEYANAKWGSHVGGGLSYTFYQHRRISASFLSKCTLEAIDTNIPNAHPKKSNDSLITVSGLGLSGGILIWTNIFKKSSIGLKVLYTYSTYNRSKHLTHPIGGNSTAVSLVFRFPRRSLLYAKWYNTKY